MTTVEKTRSELLQQLRDAGFQSYNLEIGFEKFEQERLNNTGDTSAEFSWLNDRGNDVSVGIERIYRHDEESDQFEYMYKEVK